MIKFYKLTTNRGLIYDNKLNLNQGLVGSSPRGRVSLLDLAAEHLTPVPEFAAPVPLVLLHLVEEQHAPSYYAGPHRVCGQRGAAKCLGEADVRGHSVCNTLNSK